jgi:hypothetical protein
MATQFALTSISVGLRCLCGAWLVLGGSAAVRAQEAAANDQSCGNGEPEMATDRPDVTNSSQVVQRASLQIENGINWTSGQQGTVIDGSNTRVRVGVATCTEVLIDLPDYVHSAHGSAASGFSDFSPAIKRQFPMLPGNIELSMTAGLDLPTGAAQIAGRGYGGYLQLPWSKRIDDDVSVSGMFTTFFVPGRSVHNPTFESTLAVERRLGTAADVFIEYVVDQPLRAAPTQIIDSGATYRLTATRQIDIRVGFGLDRAAPSLLFGLGYSVRFDGVL